MYVSFLCELLWNLTKASTSTTGITSAKYVAEAVQHFITLMDSLKLNMVAVDQLHPLLSDLVFSCFLQLKSLSNHIGPESKQN